MQRALCRETATPVLALDTFLYLRTLERVFSMERLEKREKAILCPVSEGLTTARRREDRLREFPSDRARGLAAESRMFMFLPGAVLLSPVRNHSQMSLL